MKRTSSKPGKGPIADMLLVNAQSSDPIHPGMPIRRSCILRSNGSERPHVLTLPVAH
jgi:hypothetical protein